MLTKEELQLKLKPIVIAAGRDAMKFADLALPLMQEHILEDTSKIDEAFDIWDCVIRTILEEIKKESSLH